MNKKRLVVLLVAFIVIAGLFSFLMLKDDGNSVQAGGEHSRGGGEKTDVDPLKTRAIERSLSESDSVASELESPFTELGVSLKGMDFTLAREPLDEGLLKEVLRIGDFYEAKNKLLEARLARIETDGIGKYTIVVPAFYESGGRDLEVEYLRQVQGLTDDTYKRDVVLAKALNDRQTRLLSFGYGEKRIELDFTNRTEYYTMVTWDVQTATSTFPIARRFSYPLSMFMENKEIEHLRFLIPENELKAPPASSGKG